MRRDEGMREEDFDNLIRAHGGSVTKVAMHPDDLTELNNGCEVPWTPDGATTYGQKGVIVVLDPTVGKGSMRILEFHDTTNRRSCPRCSNQVMVPGLCQECRINDLEQKMHALRETIREYMPMAIPKGEHELSMIEIRTPDLWMEVPIWVSVVVHRPVLIMDPGSFARMSDTPTSKVQIIKDEWIGVGGAARSTERKPIEMDPVEGEPMGVKK